MRRRMKAGVELGREARTVRRHSGGFMTVLEVQVVAVVAAALLGAVMVRQSTPPAAVCARQQAWWPERVASLEQRLQENPGDRAAKVRLANVRIGQALTEAQRAFAGDDANYDVTNQIYRRHITAHLRASPQVARAEATLREIARTAPDRTLRTRAWTSLSLLCSFRGDTQGQHDCLAAAYREQPLEDYRRALNALRNQCAEGGVIE